MLEDEVVRDGWNIVSSIALTSDVKVASLELRELLKEADEELGHIFSDFLLVGVEMGDTSMRETCTDWLVYVDEVSVLIP